MKHAESDSLVKQFVVQGLSTNANYHLRRAGEELRRGVKPQCDEHFRRARISIEQLRSLVVPPRTRDAERC